MKSIESLAHYEIPGGAESRAGWLRRFAYMMGLTGVLILIAELLFDAAVFAQFNLYIISALILIPVLISPWETLNSQLAGRQREVRSSVSADLIRRIFTLAFLVIITLLVLAYGLRLNGTLTPTWIAFAMLTFMAPTIFATESWALLGTCCSSTNGVPHVDEKTPLTRIKMDSLGVCSPSSWFSSS